MEEFANSPDLASELMQATMDARTAMSTQALNSERARAGPKGILMDHAGLYEGLRGERGARWTILTANSALGQKPIPMRNPGPRALQSDQGIPSVMFAWPGTLNSRAIVVMYL